MSKLNPTPTRKDLTDRECATIISGVMGPLALMTDVATLRRSVEWILQSEDIWRGFAQMEQTVDDVKAAIVSRRAAPHPAAGHPILVYRPKSAEEIAEREQRALTYNRPFERAPGDFPSLDCVLGKTKSGKPITVEMVQIIHNDRLLFDHISDNGAHGPTFAAMVADQDTADILECADRLYYKLGKR